MKEEKEDNKCDVLYQLLCMACLCSDRNLQTLKDDCLLRYNTIVKVSLLSNRIPKVCWECGTRLKKVVLFRQRVEECFNILEIGDHSSEVSYPPRLWIYNNVTIDIQPQNTCTNLNQENNIEVVFLPESPMHTQIRHNTQDIKPVFESDMNLSTVLSQEIKIESEEIMVEPEFVFVSVMRENIESDNLFESETKEIKIESQNLLESETKEIKIESQNIFESDTKETVIQSERLIDSTAEKIHIKSEKIDSDKEEAKQDIKIEVECLTDPYRGPCMACLCVNRKLHHVKNIILKQYYIDILKEKQVAHDYVMLQMCFECLSILKSSICFEDQVRDSYRSLFDTQDTSSLLSSGVSRSPRLRRSTTAYVDIQPRAHTDVDISRTQGQAVERDSIEPGEPAGEIENRHLVRKSNKRKQREKVQCNQCFKYFKSNGSLTRHMRLHTGVKAYKCSLCPKEFHAQSNVNRHMKIHTVDQRHSCSLCPKAFALRESLILHMITHGLNYEQIKQLCRNEDEKRSNKKYQCSQCPKTFTTKSNLSRHNGLHTGDMPYQCNECLKSFLNKSSLVKHIRVHTGEKPFKCTECSKSFSQRVHQRMHMSIHSGERPYWCKDCSKTFTRKTYLNIHINKTHSSAKQSGSETKKYFQCNQCSKEFSRKESLIKHIRTHTGEKPNQCSQCPKAFSQKGHLRIHMRTHTGELPYLCTYCTKAFPIKGRLNRHILTHRLTK